MKTLKRLWRHNNRLLFVLFGVLIAVSVLGLITLNNKFKADGGTYFTYYIRTDGGTDTQCNGLSDAAYPGTGLNQNCAWKHPFYALPPGGTPRIAGGDTLIINQGSYMMGYNPELGFTTGVCNTNWRYSCTMPALPSGPDIGHPTRILGQGYDTKTGEKPELWATERASQILNLTNSNYIEVKWLDLTDHSACVGKESVNGETCTRDSAPYGEFGDVGLYAKNSKNVILNDLNIHGLARQGIHAGNLENWYLDRVRISANGSAGWDADMGDDYKKGIFVSNNTGDISLKHVTVEWSGCAETYPGLQPTHCRGQNGTNYSDGIGLARTEGNWLIEDSHFDHNLSDGVDLLYHTTGTITINRLWAEGNVGNPVKVGGTANITNSVIISNCDFFQKNLQYMDTEFYTANNRVIDSCRAFGSALVVAYWGGETTTITNNTLYSRGDVIINPGPRVNCEQVDQDLANPDNANNVGLHADKADYCTVGGAHYTAATYSSCNGTEHIIGRNNILHSDWDVVGGSYDKSAYFYFEHCNGLTFDSNYSVYDNGKISMFIPGSHDINADPLLTLDPVSNPNTSFFGDTGSFKLSEGSPAIGAGTSLGAPAADYALVSRDSPPDIGAYQYIPTNEGSITLTMPTSSSSDGLFHTYANRSLSFAPTVSNATSYQWTSTGPGNVTFGSATASNTTVSFDTVGDYTLTLTASDDSGYTASRSVTVKVHKLADINGDNNINATDFALLLFSWGTSPVNPMAKLNTDMVVDSADFALLLFNWGK